jgi:hypothetical protein
MMMRVQFLGVFSLLVFFSSCNVLPDAIEGYSERCIQMNVEPILPVPDDPHEGIKNVFACNIELEVLESGDAPPYPDGTMIIKESRRVGETHRWLIATAEKKGGTWEWKEYTRNFAGEDFVQLAVSEQVCSDCHKAVKDSGDWMYTFYNAH